MMWYTHAAMSASAAWLLVPFLPQNDSTFIAVLLVFCVIGAMVPDLDAVESKIKHPKILGIKSFVRVRIQSHQPYPWTPRITALATRVGRVDLVAPTFKHRNGWLPFVALSLGYISHLAVDACTKTGIPLLNEKRQQNRLCECGI